MQGLHMAGGETFALLYGSVRGAFCVLSLYQKTPVRGKTRESRRILSISHEDCWVDARRQQRSIQRLLKGMGAFFIKKWLFLLFPHKIVEINIGKK